MERSQRWDISRRSGNPGINERGGTEMKLYAACMMCLLSGQERKLRECRDEDKKARYMKELLRLTADSGEDACAPWLAAGLVRFMKNILESRRIMAL